jgi:hypothetical protein
MSNHDSYKKLSQLRATRVTSADYGRVKPRVSALQIPYNDLTALHREHLIGGIDL